MAEIDPVTLLEPAATRVRDPVTGRSLWLAGMVRQGRVRDGALHFDVVFTAAHGPTDRTAIVEALTANLKGLGFQGPVRALHAGELPARPGAAPTPVHSHGPGHSHGHAPAAGAAKPKPTIPGMTGPGMQPHGGPIELKAIPGLKHLITVTSAKGGVGKSTVSTNLAAALQRLGHPTGLLDADIYGPSVPMMMNATARPLVNPETKRILPVVAHGVRCLSMGMLMEQDVAMIWRGPMVSGAVRQFLQEADWAGLDYLVVDLPPGTGDIQLTMLQAVQIAGAIVVTTPQDVALADAVRGIQMFRKLEVPILGLVENMSWYELPDGSRDHIFGEGGGKRTAEAFDIELLGQIPIQSTIRRASDKGTPVALTDGPAAEAFLALARRVVAKLPVAT